MMKRLLLAFSLLLSVFAAGSAQAQELYGNEWIDYSKTYYKISVVNTGMHRLSYGFLDSLGLRSVNPQHLQLFRRGKEVAVYVAGEADGRLDGQDYVEFYGERNDGALDRELYKNPDHQIHQLYSLYTDTAAYFLTVNAAGGKRMRESNPAVTGRTPEPYHLQKAVYVNADRFNFGKLYDANNNLTRMPWMDTGEGYFSHYSINPRNYEITGILNVEQSGPKPFLEYATVGADQEFHKLNVNVLAPTGSRNIGYFEYDFSAFARDRKKVEFSDITAQGKFILQLVPVKAASGNNRVSFTYGVLTYPQKPTFVGAAMSIFTDSTRGASPYYKLAGTPATAVAYDITDPYVPVRVEGGTDGIGKGFVVEVQDGRTHKLFISDSTRPFKPAKVGRGGVRFRSIDPNVYNYIVLTNKRLMKVVSGSQLPAPQAYAAYRASAAGGGYDTVLFSMEQVVNLFHYGEFSSNAIRRMVRYMGTSTRAPQLFIIGKGVRYADQDYYFTHYPGKFSYYQVGARHPKVYELDLVPTGIVPSSDIVFSADFRNNSYVPRVPTGRLSVTKPEEIMAYLNKVKEYEAAGEGEAWRKNVLQLGGGKTTSEINQISNYLKDYTRIAEGPLVGAHVVEKYRQNVSEVVETINVSEQINKGISLLTFFGHSSPGTTDLDIGYVSSAVNNYNNKGKYPLMLMNGCNAGNAFVPNYISFGEDWLKTPDKGAVSLIAHVDVGYPNYLNLYSNYFYNVAFQEPQFYGTTLGEVQKETIRRVTQVTTSDLATAMVLEMALQGDPALKPYNPSKPDYVLKESGFELTGLDGSLVTASADSFKISFDVDNLGKAITDPIYITVKRKLADNTVLLQDSMQVDAIIKGRRVTLKVPNKGVTALGMNTFEITLDGPNAVEELNEDNNTVSFQHFFPISGLATVYPANYSIVGAANVKLAVQATVLRDNQNFYFELDTTSAFNSPLRRSQTVANTILPVWETTLPVTSVDSVVYYWRARFTEYEAGEDTIWTSSSFRHVSGAKGGWSQSHYAQLQSVKTTGLDSLSAQNRNWQFSPINTHLSIKTVGGNTRFADSPYGLFLNEVQQLWGPCGNPTGSALSRIYLVVFDKYSLEPVTTLPGISFCTDIPFLFDTGDLSKAANVTKLKNFLGAVPDGYHVAAISINKVPFSTFPSDVKAAFRSIGSALIDNLVTGAPFGIVGRKGAAVGTVEEKTAAVDDPTPVASQSISMDVTLNSTRAAGTLTSVAIGPALQWGTLYHNIEKYKGGDDRYKLGVIGIDTLGKETLLLPDVDKKAMDLAAIDASVYPNLRLSAFVSDSTARSAPQLKEWFVYYEGVPEGVVRPDLVNVNSEILTAQAARGNISLPMAFQNISQTAFRDSVVVEVNVTGDGIQPTVTRFKIKAVEANETVMFTYDMPTLALDGNYKVSLYVNPRVQPEQHYFNNIYEVGFSVKSKLHPVMDVAFDGVHILDGDLISPSPLISVTVKDENQNVFLQDPASMSLILITPEGQEQEVSLLNNPQEVSYTVATAQNDFRLEYKPTKLLDGKYAMEVRARDASGKASGISPYRIGFEVVSEASVTNFYPFPNPFSTKTNFIFTLTGSTVPEHMKIQVLTVTGKVVKEIMKEELGPLRIGNNKTEYAWDGTDTYGDRLANGVYLYRVVMSKIDEEMKHRNTFGDKAFKNGYGKLYILR
ncbi:C25 family cysteine peptidase [Pontibacter sp. E15-1]|uniref:putative type IX secretion system sortase PorU2 n=1 Tax=Pontibacter sp. E15-1 TaxID=2919918 RepID=UPI001F4FD942|nr:C25 family cysteine peptidase [Pontibacter sp. E15-1]MCJ8164907.1 C25 family cysteine peptidase [Pontibacter sp. E15-1]